MFRKSVVILLFILSVTGCGGKSKEELYAEGTKQLKEGNANGAIVLFKNALEKDQNYLDARYQLAKAYMSARKHEQAEKEFRKVIRQNPSRTDVRLEIAKLYNATSKPDMAISEAGEYLKSHAGAPDALEVIGIGYAIKKRPDEAESYLLQALKADPGRISAMLDLAGVYASVKREREARALLDEIIRQDGKNSRGYYMLAALETSLGNKDKALQQYKRIMEIAPSDLTAGFKAGLLLIEMGELDNAERIADDLIRKSSKRPEGHTLKGIICYYNKNYDMAISELQSSLKFWQYPGAFYFLGLSHYNKKEFELALNQFRKVVDIKPENVQSRVMIAGILLSQKRVDDALSEAKKAVQQNDEYAGAHNILGNVYMAKGMYDEAMGEFNRSIDLDPRLVDAYLKKGLFKLGRGRAKEGEEDLQTAVKMAPDALSARLLLVSYHMKQKNYTRAVSLLKEGIRGGKEDALLYNNLATAFFADKKEKEGLASFQKAKEVDPNYFTPYFNLAMYHAARKEHEKALAEYKGVLQRSPGNTKALIGSASILELQGKNGEAVNFLNKAKETRQSAGYLALADYHLRKKEPGKALEVLDEACDVDPRNAAVMELKGKIYLDGKKYKEAVKTFEELESIAPDRALPLQISTFVTKKDFPQAIQNAKKAINNKPNSAYGYILLASVHESQNNLAEAVNALREGLKVEPGNIPALMMLGGVHVKKREFSLALHVYEDAAKRNPNYFQAVFSQGTTYEQMGKKREAVLKYKELLKKSPDYVPALNNLAYLYADGYGEKGEALRLAARAYQIAPENASVMDTHGYALLKNNRHDEARKILEKAVTLMPQNSTVCYHLALAEKASGNKAQAMKFMQKALDLGNFAEANNARLLLAELKR